MNHSLTAVIFTSSQFYCLSALNACVFMNVCCHCFCRYWQEDSPPLAHAVKHLVSAIEKCRIYCEFTARHIISYKQVVIKGKRNLLIMSLPL